MADKLNSLVPIVHSSFKNEVDKEFVDVEDLRQEYLAETKNLSTCRVENSLSLFGGTSFASLNSTDLSVSNLPNPGSGFKLIDFYVFNVDRDAKEVYFLVFEHSSTKEIKLYINPYYNAYSGFNNSCPTCPDGTTAIEGWNYKWYELTETYTLTCDGIAGNSFLTTTVPNNYYNYFKGWFAVNTTRNIIDYESTQFQYITNFDYTAKSFSCMATPTSWAAGNTIRLFRFPCIYFYNADMPTHGSQNYNNVGTTFKGKPTDYIYGQNELRIPCGKELRPLILSMIYKRQYFTGKNKSGDACFSNYDGFWFDFQQIPQVMAGSQMSAYRTTSVGVAGSTSYLPCVDPNWTRTLPATGISFHYRGTSQQIVNFITADSSVIPTGVGRVQKNLSNGHITIWLRYDVVVSNSELYGLIYNSGMLTSFDLVLIGAANFTAPGGWINFESPEVFSPEGTSTYGQDGGNNGMSNNLFLGSQVNTPLTDSFANVGTQLRTPFILTALYDNRNEILMGHGNMFSNPKYSVGGSPTSSETTSEWSLQCRFNSWFNRRLTNIKLYIGTSQSITSAPAATILGFTSYPYFAWHKDSQINMLPGFGTYDISEFTKSNHGELGYSVEPITDATVGMNSYTLHKAKGYFYVAINDWYLKTGTKGKGLTFISDTNRYIDQDTTMNYTRGTFMGQTNGRLFIIGCKNTVQRELFESDDYVMYSNLAAGVSQYDQFLTDRFLNINIGDKDQNRSISQYNGYLIIIKDTNVFTLDINTEDELRFRVVKTNVGRGVIEPNTVCYTPHGIVLPAKDSVYLISPNGSKVLFREDNGRLNFYRTYFAYQNFESIYYNEYNEIFLIQKSTGTSDKNYILVYNFNHDRWTTIVHNADSRSGVTAYVKARTNANREIVLANVNSNTEYNFVKIDELTNYYRNSAGVNESLEFTLKTHLMPYGHKIQDILLDTFTLHFNYYSGNKNLKLVVSRKNRSDETLNLSLPSNAGIEYNKVYNTFSSYLGECDQLSITLQNLSGSTIQHLDKFIINSFILWITTQNRQLVQGLS